ncbi:hypothetical protein KFL_000150320 [Klebsormidium nitens]|uniref:Glycosyltransferase subfamily 4-like N-terminal domain-containing protein n=1 Tax=Klebsormidium nitens TaxID=105231 RepID=A0A1Y1HRW8_KLENI|nr:hypothetical protein KFL_000150320 [Klebsormidium nitens]|eukprot:GAQ78578.1 hypothetical protein KFL_000150320 [Klebsormidium nitens]
MGARTAHRRWLLVSALVRRSWGLLVALAGLVLMVHLSTRGSPPASTVQFGPRKVCDGTPGSCSGGLTAAEVSKAPAPLRIGILSSYPPQKCGVAEGTYDLYHRGVVAAGILTPHLSIGIVVVDDEGTPYSYGDEVSFVIRKWEVGDYVRAADVINRHFDVLNVHHEYGIFGGESGELVLALLTRLTIPVVTELHTVPLLLTAQAKVVLQQILSHSTLVQVFLPSLCARLRTQVSVKINCTFGPHGVPEPVARQRDDPDKNKKLVIFTPGLLAPVKSIESMIEAMREVKAALPRAVYHIQGDPPKIAGDYVETLRRLAETLGVGDAVRIEVTFVSKDELIRQISGASLVITPYIDPTQVSSGVLALAVGLKRPAIATPFEYAQWLCNRTAPGPPACALVPFRDARALAAAAIDILRDPNARRVAPSAAHARGMLAHWPELAPRWVALLRDVTLTWRNGSGSGARESAQIGAREKNEVGRFNDGEAVRTDDLARELFSTASQKRREEVNRWLRRLTFGGVRFAGWAPPLKRCVAQRGKDDTFHIANGVSALHGQVDKGQDHMIKHTLLHGSDLVLGTAGVRYGGLFVSARSEIGRLETRLVPDAWEISGGRPGSDAFLRLETLLSVSETESKPVGRVSTFFSLRPGFAGLTLDFRIEAFGGCLREVEIVSGMDSMSSLFPGLVFDSFYGRLANGEARSVSAASGEVMLYDRTRDELPDWSLVSNKKGQFGVITIPRNQSLLVSTFCSSGESDNGDANFHYVASRYFVGQVCEGYPKSVIEDKFLVSNIDPKSWSALDGVLQNVNSFRGFDLSGPVDTKLVEDAFRTQDYHRIAETSH